MAKKRKPRKRTYTPPAPKAAPVAASEEAPVPKTPTVRKQNKEEARRARERAIKQMRRRAALRRTFTFVIVLVVVGGLFFLLTRVGTPTLSEETVTAAEAAGCSDLEEQADRGRSHEGPFVYEDQPATSGPHDPTPAAAGVYTEAPAEEQLVHAMEHGYVVVYYRADGEEPLDPEVVEALTTDLEEEEQVILSPHASLPDGVDLAYAAWTYLVTCPGGVEPEQATTIADGFIEALRDSRTAPEAQVD